MKRAWHYYAYIPSTHGYTTVIQGPFWSCAAAEADISGRYSVGGDSALARYSQPFAVDIWSAEPMEYSTPETDGLPW